MFRIKSKKHLYFMCPFTKPYTVIFVASLIITIRAQCTFPYCISDETGHKKLNNLGFFGGGSKLVL
jgi:hypothetical protein